MTAAEPAEQPDPSAVTARQAKAAATSAPTPLPVSRVRIELPNATIVKVLVVIAGIWLLLLLWDLLFLILLGALLAGVLDRPVRWLQRRGLPRGAAIAAVIAVAVGFLALLVVLLGPRLVNDLQEFWNKMPDYVEQALDWFSAHYPELYERIQEWAQEQQENVGSGSFDLRGLLSQGINIITGVVNVVIVFIVAVYILADQGRSVDGLIRRLPPAREAKLRRTIPAVTTVVNGYVTGQACNSLLFGTFSLVLLTALDVPSAAVLALIAAIGDAIPQIGVTLATIPAVLLAMTKSWQTAVIVLVAYVIYQQIENYVIAPRVFGRTLGLSPLVTMVAVLVGAKLLGIIGVLIALPIAAAIPEVVRIWSAPDADPADTAAQPALAAPASGSGDAPG